MNRGRYCILFESSLSWNWTDFKQVCYNFGLMLCGVILLVAAFIIATTRLAAFSTGRVLATLLGVKHSQILLILPNV